MSTSITDIFFDLDHTLWDFDANSALAYQQIFSEYFPTINCNDFMNFYVPINHELWKLYREDLITHEELRYQRLYQSFEKINYTVSNEQIAFVSDEYLRILPINNLLLEGTKEILEYLFPKYNLHIITNGFAKVQVNKLVNSGIERYFKTVTNSEIAGFKKPNPKIFEFALSLANANKENSIMIGDCIDADVKGALNFGMKAILYDQFKVANESELTTINHLSKLKELL
jgi:YjjG family noncanonical pyrimidine nucleotidase